VQCEIRKTIFSLTILSNYAQSILQDRTWIFSVLNEFNDLIELAIGSHWLEQKHLDQVQLLKIDFALYPGKNSLSNTEKIAYLSFYQIIPESNNVFVNHSLINFCSVLLQAIDSNKSIGKYDCFFFYFLQNQA